MRTEDRAEESSSPPARLRVEANAPVAQARGEEAAGVGQSSAGALRVPALVWRLLPWVGAALIGALLLPKLAEYLGHSWAVVTFPWQIDFDEGINANASWLLAQGVSIYRPNPPDHFISSMYPPLFFGLNAAAMELFGLNLWSGRLLSLLGALGAAAALWAWVWVETRKHWAGLLSALLWLSLGPVYVWSSFYKQDMAALALGLTGGALAAGWSKRFLHKQGSMAIALSEAGFNGRTSTSRKLLYASLVPLALAFWMKQSSLAPMAAVGLMILRADWRLALRWGAWALGSIVVPFVGLDLLLKGGLHTHVLAFDYYGRSVARLGRNMDALWTQHWPLVLCGAAWLLWAFGAFAAGRVRPPLSAFYLLVATPAALLSNSLPTANYNHLLDLLAPLCLAVGALAGASQWITGDRQMRAAAVVAGVFLLACIQVALCYAKPGWTWYTPLGIPLQERAQRMEKLSELVRTTPGDILSEDNWLLLKNGKRVLYDDPAAMAALANAGAWDQSIFVRDLQRRKFPLVLLQYDISGETFNPRWTEEGLSTLKENYDIRFRDVIFVHVPKAAPAEPEKSSGCEANGMPALVGYTFRADTANRGDVLPLSLYWNKTADTEPNGRFFVRLLDGSGAPKWGADLTPGQAAGKAFEQWSSGETVRDDLSIPVAADLPDGDYRLALGSYTVDASGKIERLQMRCAAGTQQPDATITLSTIKVVQRWGK